MGANITPFQQGMTQAQRSLNTFGMSMTSAVNASRSSTNAMGSILGKVGGIVAAAFAVSEMVAFGKGAIELASNLNEVQNVVDVTFGSMANQINAFSKGAITQFGISELSAKKFSSTMGAMLKSSGISGQQLVTMSKGIAGLSADMASFYNLDSQTAFDKIRAGIAGETEPLRQLGINMSVANMEAYALSQGITTKYQAMDQAAQSLLRYNYLMEVSKDAQGDFARTTSSWANQTRLLSQQWDIMKTTLGQGLMNMLAPLLTVINSVIAKLQVATAWFKAFAEMIWGSAGAVSAVVTPAAGATDGMDAMGASADNTGSKVKKAATAIKGSLGAFDQLNLLGQKAGAVDDSGGAGGSGVGAMPSVNLGKTPNVKLPDWLSTGINVQPLMDSLGKMKTALEPFTNTLFDGLKWAYDNVLVPLGTWVIQDYLPAFFKALAGALTILNPLLLSFQPAATWLWANFLQPLATWTGGVIVSVLTGLGVALTQIGNWMSANQPIVDAITTSVLAFMAAWKVVELLAFIQLSGGVVAALTAVTDAVIAGTIAKIADKLETMALTAMYAKDLVISLAAGTLSFLQQTAQVWLLSASMAAQALATGLVTAGTWLLNAAIAVLTSPITLVIAALALLGLGIYKLITHWDDVKKAGASAWEGIKGVWNQASVWFGDKVVTPIKHLFSGLWDGVGSVFKGIANTMIGAINYLIRGLNRIHFDMPDWVPDTFGGGRSFGVSISQIPKLAGGGMVSSPTLAMIGDNKNAYSDPEVVSPLSKLQDMIDKSISNAIGGNGGGDTTVILKIGETEFGRVAIKSINSVHRQTGMTLLTV